MTNAEKYKTIEERSKAFNEICTSSGSCERCPIRSPLGSGLHCAFTWLELEAQLSTSEVADILEEYVSASDKSDNKGVILTSPELYKAIARAVEILRGLEEKNNA